MAAKTTQEAQQPLILRAHRLMESFAKSDDERDFYLDRVEGYIIYVDLDKTQAELEELERELIKHPERYCLIPKLTFYETKKIMEGFVNEKVYDIDTKEKLLDIIQSKEARYNFLEFIYDHHTELEKWQQYYQERSRIRIIEWLRQNHFHFVFEEDLELARGLLEKLKRNLFQKKVSQDIASARKILVTKAKTYYSNEALNPRPKRGRPPKQVVKQEIEPQLTTDIYLTVAAPARPFLFTPDISSAADITFSAQFDSNELRAARKQQLDSDATSANMASLQQKLAALRNITRRFPQGKVNQAPLANNTLDSKVIIDEEEFTPKKNNKATLAKKPKPTPPAPKAKAKPAPKAKPKLPPAPPRKAILRPVIRDNKKNSKEPEPRQGRGKHKRIIPVQKLNAKSKPLTKLANPPKRRLQPKIAVTKKAPPKRPAKPLRKR